MTTDEEKKLWDDFSRTKSLEIRDEIVRRYLPLIKYVVGRMSVTPPQGLDYD